MATDRDLPFLAEVNIAGRNFDNIPARLIFHEDEDQQPEIEIYPQDDNYHAISYLPAPFEIKSSVNDKSNKKVKALSVFRTGGRITYGGIVPQPAHIRVSADLLFVEDNYHRTLEKDSNSIEFHFQVTENEALDPNNPVKPGYNGFPCTEKGKESKLELPDREIVFDRVYSYRGNSSEINIKSNLTAIIKEGCYEDISIEAKAKELIPIVDDVLLAVSYATRKYTTCLRWHALHAEGTITCYRGNRARPNNEEARPEGGPFDPWLKNLVERCYRALQDADMRHSLSLSFNCLSPNKSNSLEMDFVQKFTCFESLIHAQTKINGHGKAIKERSKWDKVRRDLKKHLNDTHNLSDTEKHYLTSNLTNLNYLPLEQKYKELAERLNIQEKTSPPLFKSSKGHTSAYELRNIIVHGKNYGKETIMSIIEAKGMLDSLLIEMVESIINSYHDKTK